MAEAEDAVLYVVVVVVVATARLVVGENTGPHNKFARTDLQAATIPHEAKT